VSLQIAFPVEFIVSGTPASLQTKRPETRAIWKRRVRQASQSTLPEGHFATRGPIAVTLFYFPDAMMRGDIDNIVKPVLDALSQHIYVDDQQVERVWVQKFEPGGDTVFNDPSSVLANAILANAILGVRPLLFVRVTNDPKEGLQ
jgi:crossover junction endodeoxyribonuclease RusA